MSGTCSPLIFPVEVSLQRWTTEWINPKSVMVFDSCLIIALGIQSFYSCGILLGQVFYSHM